MSDKQKILSYLADTETEFLEKLKDHSLEILKEAQMCNDEKDLVVLGFVSVLCMQVIADYKKMVKKSSETAAKKVDECENVDGLASYLLELLEEINNLSQGE